MDLSNWLKCKQEEGVGEMITLYDWLKREKIDGKGHLRVTFMYDDFVVGPQRACIKRDRYSTTLDGIKESCTINYLLLDINPSFLDNYYITKERMANNTVHDDFDYELTVTDKIPHKSSNSDCSNRIFGKKHLEIEKVIFSGPATIVFWSDGTKTIAKCDKDDALDYEKGILYAALKKLSNKEEYNDILRVIDALSCMDDDNQHEPIKGGVEIEYFPEMREEDVNVK